MYHAALNNRGKWPWSALAAFGLVFWIVYIYRDTAASMISIWARSDTFAHGFLVVPIGLWLVWRRRYVLVATVPSASPTALLLIALLGLAWLLGDMAGVNAIVQLALVGMIVSAIVAAIGWSAARTITFPLVFLFFAVPIGEFLLPVLMERTADFTVFALRLSGIPVYREGLQFVIPTGNWSVVEACSGVRYLIASLTVGTLFSYLNFRTWKRRSLFVLVSILVPIVANWLRAYLIVLLGHLSENELATGVDHLVYGWLFFGFVIAVMFAIGARWAQPENEESPPRIATPRDHRSDAGKVLRLVAGAALILSAAPRLFYTYLDRAGVQFASPDVTVPKDLAGGWRQRDVALSDWKPVFLDPTSRVDAAYGLADKTVGLHIAYYKNQTYNRKLISSSNTLLRADDKRWRKVDEGQHDTACGDRRVMVRTVNLSDYRTSDQTSDKLLTIWQYYWINDSLLVNDKLAVLYGTYFKLIGRGDGAASVIMYSAGPRSRESIEAFMRDNCEVINKLFREGRNLTLYPH